LFGAEWDWTGNWRGRIEGVVLRSVALGPHEAEASCRAYAPRLRRPRVARVRLRGRLEQRTEWSSKEAGLTSAYPRLMVVYRYRVEEVLAGTYPHAFAHVAHWAVLDRRTLRRFRRRAVGSSHVLELEDIEDHPEVESEEYFDDIDVDFDLPLMLDVAPLGMPARSKVADLTPSPGR
jgi:hypothetical protein